MRRPISACRSTWGAMGDFETDDTMLWQYQFAGEAVQTAFSSTIDEAGSQTYTLEGGGAFLLDDPMSVNGTLLSNNLTTVETALTQPAGPLTTLTVTLTVETDGGTEAMAFQNLVVLDAFAPQLSISCGADVNEEQGTAASGEVTAIDEDDTSSIALISDDMGGAFTVGALSGGGLGEQATLPYDVADTLGAGSYSALFRATNGTGETADCTLSVVIDPPAPFLTIAQIQGSGQFSPYVGQTVKTEGIVTLIDSSGSDAWIQMTVGDGDPATSDGIFIDDFSGLDGPPAIGDVIMVQGEVEEQQFGNALPRTRIDDTVLLENKGPG